MAVDAKDQITHGHIRRVQVFALELAKRLGVVDDRQIKALEAAALLHDMGKLGIPEHILNKPGRLTDAEFSRMKQHADLGADLLSSIRFPYPVIPIVRHHHENWDGSGYPCRIAGTDIPLGARILSVVDCFDALTSDRPYRPRLSTEEAFRILRERRGAMYDPLVVDTFIRAHSEIAPIAIRAGQESRSVWNAELPSRPNEANTASPLRQIRANASESGLLVQYRRGIVNAESPVAMLEAAAQCLRHLMPATVVALFTNESRSNDLICMATIGDDHEVIRRLIIPIGQRISGWAAANGRTVVNADATLDLAEIAVMFEPPLRSTISAGMKDGEHISVLTAYSTRENGFTENHRYGFEYVAAACLEARRPVLAGTTRGVIAFHSRTK
jgi:putative nucleotidyltransferase with HDIG domain